MKHLYIITYISNTIILLLVTIASQSFSQQIQDYIVDTSFKTNFEGNSPWCHGSMGEFLVNDDQSIFVTGDFSCLFNPKYWIKLNPDGSINTSFHLPTFNIEPHGGPCRLYKHDQSYFVGFFEDPPGIVKLLSDGSLDTSFDINYHNKLQYAAGFFLRDIIVDSLGKVMVAGYFKKQHESSYSLIRFNPDGSLDSSFIRSRSNYENYLIVPLPGSKYLIGGWENDTTAQRHALWRINYDGSLDTSFDTQCPWGATGRGAVLSDGKLITSGFVNHPVYGDSLTMVRWNTDGSLDTTFKYFTGTDITSFILQPDRIIIGGFFNKVQNFHCRGLAAIDYSGNIDSTMFGSLGPDSASPSVLDPGIYNFGLTPQGEIMACGAFTWFGGFKTFDIVRLKRLFVGINETQIDPNNEIKLLPNPASDIINVRLKQIHEGEIRIFDLMGRSIIAMVTNNTTSEYSISIQDLAPGIYYLKFISLSSLFSASKQFVVIR